MVLFLSFSEQLRALIVVLLQGLVLERQLVELSLHALVLSSCQVSISVTLQNVDLSLQSVVLFVEEIDLALQLLDSVLVLLLLVLDVQFFEVLSRLEQVVQAQDFIVSDLGFLSEFLVELLLGTQLVLKVVDHKLELVASLVRLPDFYSPLVLIA